MDPKHTDRSASIWLILFIITVILLALHVFSLIPRYFIQVYGVVAVLGVFIYVIWLINQGD
jgi:hypothetical protein